MSVDLGGWQRAQLDMATFIAVMAANVPYLRDGVGWLEFAVRLSEGVLFVHPAAGWLWFGDLAAGRKLEMHGGPWRTGDRSLAAAVGRRNVSRRLLPWVLRAAGVRAITTTVPECFPTMQELLKRWGFRRVGTSVLAGTWQGEAWDEGLYALYREDA